MKFIYQYRTSDNVQHDGEVCAPNREAAFRKLREQGIRPARLNAAPGLANWVVGIGKVWFIVFALSVAVIILSVAIVIENESNEISAMDRHQIYGEPAFMDELDRDEFAKVLDAQGERYLACFAQPGIIHKFSDHNWKYHMAQSLRGCLTNRIEVLESDRREVREIKLIVQGMKQELEAYLSDGVGTPELFVKRLMERQEKELQLFLSAKNEVERMPERLAIRNASLRSLGLPTIEPPEELPENR